MYLICSPLMIYIFYRPDTATFIHKMEREREAKEKGANQDNRSFLAKYVSIFFNPFCAYPALILGE